MSLEKDIQQWDGKSSDDISVIYSVHCNQKDFVNKLITLVNNEQCQKGATWLIKNWLSENNSLNSKQTKKILNDLSYLKCWESKLHILQSLPFILIDKNQVSKVENFLRVTLTDTNKFVRAWSYNGFYELAKQHSEYQKETKAFFKMAMRDEAPSVKARIRNIQKQGF